MLKRILSILIIMLLLGFSGLPFLSLSGNPHFVYATEETLDQEETIEAGLIAYLNSRNGFIVSTANGPVDTVKMVMQSWINSADFWSNTTVGGIAELYANIIIRYNPFRVSLRGPAVRAFNDLYDWLIDTGKLPDLDSDTTGGTTTDNVYNGYSYGNNLFYMIDNNVSDINNVPAAKVLSVGSPVNGLTGDILYNTWMNNNPNSDMYSNDGETENTDPTITINYSSNISITTTLNRYITVGGHTEDEMPTLALAQKPNVLMFSDRVEKIRGNPCWFVRNDYPNRFSYGVVSHNLTTDKFWFSTISYYSRDDIPVVSSNASLDTNNFDKTNPTPPANDNEITYTPKVKETSGNYTEGDTFNTYNEYINNYVNKNTTVVKTDDSGSEEPETPGGTTPPWTGGSAGTLTPDGNGGYDLSLPDLTLPDLDIDWSINGLKDKFPFSIPFDLMAFFTVLNAEPETPAIQGEIDLGIVNWEIDWNLEQFNTLAALLRNLEFIGFCIGLIIITRNIIKG